MSTISEINEKDIELPLKGENPKNFIQKPKILLILISTFILVGKNYCFYIPQSLETHFLNGKMRLTNVQFDLFYSFYSFPNILLPLFGGIFIDKLGNRISLILFSSLVVLGQFLFLMGTSFSSYFFMIFGRVLFGLGSENLLIAQHTIIVKWAKKNELALAIALQAAIAKIGAVLNTSLTPAFYDKSGGFFLPVFVGLLTCVVSFIATMAVCFVDKKYEGRLEKIEEKKRVFNFKVLRNFDGKFWMLTFHSSLIFGAYTAFSSNENHILSKSFGMSAQTAGNYLIIIYVTSIFMPALIGIFTDKYGRKPSLMIFLTICFITCVMMLNFLPSNCSHPILVIPLILHGTFLAGFFPVVWTCIPMIVDPSYLGTAYGVLTSFVNTGSAVSPLIFGAIADRTKPTYFWPLIYITFQGIAALYGAVMVFIIDFSKGVLERPKTYKT